MNNQLTLAMFLACCLAVFLGSSVMVAATPTIPNPSFEVPGHTDSNPFLILLSGSTYITGWTVGGAGVDYFRADVNPLFATDGLYSVNYVRGPGGGGSLSTIISGLVAGTEYDLSFDVIQRDLGAGTALTVMVDSTSQTYINTASNVWQQQHLLFIAGGSTASLTLAGPATGALDSAFAHVDNVAIASIPPIRFVGQTNCGSSDSGFDGTNATPDFPWLSVAVGQTTQVARAEIPLVINPMDVDFQSADLSRATVSPSTANSPTQTLQVIGKTTGETAIDAVVDGDIHASLNVAVYTKRKVTIAAYKIRPKPKPEHKQLPGGCPDPKPGIIEFCKSK
jgi:hypothetical protein